MHLLAAADQQAGTVLAQAKVDGKTNKITAFAPLPEPLGLAEAVVTADAPAPRLRCLPPITDITPLRRSPAIAGAACVYSQAHVIQGPDKIRTL